MYDQNFSSPKESKTLKIRSVEKKKHGPKFSLAYLYKMATKNQMSFSSRDKYFLKKNLKKNVYTLEKEVSVQFEK